MKLSFLEVYGDNVPPFQRCQCLSPLMEGRGPSCVWLIVMEVFPWRTVVVMVLFQWMWMLVEGPVPGN